jgi:hypothetical protein
MNNEAFLSDLGELVQRHRGSDIPALTQPLTPREAGEFIQTCIKADRSFMAHGKPGVGKSEIAMQQADIAFAAKYDCTIDDYTVRDAKGKILGVHQRPWFYDFRVAQRDGVDLTGVPYVEKGKGEASTRWATPDIIADLDPRGGLFFFDEINRGSDMTRNAAFSLVTTKNVGKTAMPPTWVCGAAVNDQDIGVSKMSAALTRRFAHFEMDTDLNDVCFYAIKRGWEPVVVAFLKMFPAMLNSFNPKERVSPNARAWEFISNIVAAGPASSRVQHALFAGSVGEAAAISFSAFLRMFNELPHMDAVMNTPKTAPLPTSPGAMYAISAALAKRMTDKNIGRCLTYLNRLEQKDYAVFAVTSAMGRNPDLAKTPESMKFHVEHQELM